MKEVSLSYSDCKYFAELYTSRRTYGFFVDQFFTIESDDAVHPFISTHAHIQLVTDRIPNRPASPSFRALIEVVLVLNWRWSSGRVVDGLTTSLWLVGISRRL